MTVWIVALLAGAAGVGQAVLLRRAAHRGPGLAGLFARLMLVGAALVVAAASGALSAGVMGWGVGFAVSCLVLTRRSV